MQGGRAETGREAVEWAREGAERGAGEILLTSMDRDGTEDGYELELTRLVADAVDIPVIASGGAGNLDHLVDAVEEGGADAVLCASIFHYGQFTVGEAKRAHATWRGCRCGCSLRVCAWLRAAAGLCVACLAPASVARRGHPEDDFRAVAGDFRPDKRRDRLPVHPPAARERAATWRAASGPRQLRGPEFRD